MDWDKLPEIRQGAAAHEIDDLPGMLAGAGYVMRRVHLIRAYGDWLAKAGALMDQAEAHKDQRYHVVLAEIDQPEGFAIAERAIRFAR